MVFITLWRAGRCECLLLMGERTVELRLMKDHAVIRRSEPTTTKVALRMAAAWKSGLASIAD
jgi:hypothetical protein